MFIKCWWKWHLLSLLVNALSTTALDRPIRKARQQLFFLRIIFVAVFHRVAIWPFFKAKAAYVISYEILAFTIYGIKFGLHLAFIWPSFGLHLAFLKLLMDTFGLFLDLSTLVFCSSVGPHPAVTPIPSSHFPTRIQWKTRTRMRNSNATGCDTELD